MKAYHEIAGRRGTYLPLRFEADGQATVWVMRDAYCEDPNCEGPEVSVLLASAHDPARLIEFEIDFFKTEAHWSLTLSDQDSAIAREFTSNEYLFRLLERHRTLVRAWGLARLRNGPTAPIEDRCYALCDFDLKGEHHGMSFRSAGQLWDALDLYCVNPRCPCQEAILSFARRPPGATTIKPEFAVRLDVRRPGPATPVAETPLTAEQHRVAADFQQELGAWQTELALRRELVRRITSRRLRGRPGPPRSAGAGLPGLAGGIPLIVVPRSPVPTSAPRS